MPIVNVPHGSVLGTLLFILLSWLVKNGDAALATVEVKLCLQKVGFTANKLLLKKTKTKHVLFFLRTLQGCYG